MAGKEISDSEDIEAMETKIEGVVKELDTSSTGPDEIEGFKKEEFDVTNIEELEEKMLERTKELSEGEGLGNKSLIKLIQDCNKSDADWEFLNGIWNKTVKIFTKISQKLADFLVTLTGNVDKFDEFISRLKSVNGYKKSWVCRKTVHVLQMVDDNLTELQVESMEDEDIGFMEETECDDSSDQNEDLEDESPTDYILKHFFDVILHLESILSNHDLSESVELTGGELSQPEDGLKQCEDELEGINLKVKDLKATVSNFIRLENNELWKTTLLAIEDICKDIKLQDKEGSEGSEVSVSSSSSDSS
ncbi:hypothetical protein O6P43_032072 [Quillaja saponaria]|uniref:Uncharacterized protein n=1 Tax=Quillaja saponaria TaxID=32244 RepID=A0AAD7KY25_QUISA|nr:hypothetical protein O6P43_032072 [Quillaja saponaria]